jgi:EAL domain-containing protein (putative c-di-GMP-specific phosphodiesterase class I)
VSPDEFISLVEDDGLVVPLERWVFRNATSDDSAPLQDMQCRYVQGWLFGRPVPVTELTGVLADFDPSVPADPAAAEMDCGVHIVGRVG